MKINSIFPAMVSLMLLISLITGCTWIGTEETIAPATTTASTATQTPTSTVPPVSVQFPLAEEVTLILVAPIRRTVKNLEKNLADNQLWNDLYERTNVKVEVRALPNQDTLSSFLSMLDSNNYGDILLTQYITQPNDLDALIASHKLLPLNDYVTNRSIMPNLNSRIFDESPETKGYFTSPDGNLYFLGSYKANKEYYLETTCWINKTWLDMAQMGIPETLEELEAFFAWVMENDPNGNNEQDELPYYCYPRSGSFIERLLGMWGLPITGNTFDNHVVINDGTLQFAPMTDGYKDFLKVIMKWYANGWMPEEYFKGHSNENYDYMMNRYIHSNGQPERVAFYTGTGPNHRNQNAPDADGNRKLSEVCEYIAIMPPKVAGYETRWPIHPGYLGVRGTFAIAANCKYPEIALAWMDQFYSQEVTERAMLGEPGTPYRIDKDGKIGRGTYSGTAAEILESKDNHLDMIFPNLPTAITQDEWINRRIEASEKQMKYFAKYKDIIVPEVWPRLIMTNKTTQETGRIYEKLLDIIYTYQTDWITGDGKIDEDWTQYQSELKSAGVDRMIELMQEAYDVYLSAIK